MSIESDDLEKEYSQELRLLGERIRVLREKRGYSQETLGFKAGLHRNYISQLELAQRNPTYTTLLKIANALSVDVIDLLNKGE
ncbi:DNA-binding transcriptional regulator, XRE-family HTH domain [Paenibacillus tianmuensis]|uniref:DNA-binding transcriptional regulator, XRE-family HTH domain n=1 Tax=Paenibacillus tianmuensis TaxID=624147 RepID=A0A1G4TZD5_9BACL|nr:helix-turn-helix transcriptional regulator [Paenibacillus tianmuensis]SCW86720.1 DNA-binding transcriptional regulator, XRE-family HTH domain [Paenibacillus tianmuensis]